MRSGEGGEDQSLHGDAVLSGENLEAAMLLGWQVKSGARPGRPLMRGSFGSEAAGGLECGSDGAAALVVGPSFIGISAGCSLIARSSRRVVRARRRSSESARRL